MKIFTLNTWNVKGPWRDRWEMIFSENSKQNPDIICFQELFDEAWVRSVQKRIERPYVFQGDKGSGLVIFSRYPFKDTGCICYQIQSPNEDCNRFGAFGAVEMEGELFYVLNTHLSWKPQDAEIRLGQVRELCERADRFPRESVCLVMGDFNADPKSDAVAWMRLQGYSDAFFERHPDQEGWTWDNQNPYAASASQRLPDRRIDYIFVRDSRDRLRVESCERVLMEPREDGVYGSDHYGVVANLGRESVDEPVKGRICKGISTD